MTTKLEKLLFRIALIDSVSAPLARIDKQVQSFNKHATAGGVLLGASAAGAWALQRAVSAVIGPALDMNRALASLRTLDVQGDVLQGLEQRALRFSIRYGESAAEFVRSSYDIQSAIAGLQGNELGSFTEASAILAKGTLADMATVTDYMGTMYGIFKSNADKIGKANWVEIAAGQTATAVQMFKTNGAKMAAAFTSLGADAQAHGIQMAEQMAVLGKLQTTMSGSEAGTKYKAFLRGVGHAQAQLGLEFTDSAGRMLPMVQILEKIQGRVAGLSSVARGDLLKKAFGSDEAASLLSLLLLDTKGLADNIQSLGNVKGMDKARQMAAEMADPIQRWQAGMRAASTALGKLLLPLLTPLLDKLTAGSEQILDWSQRFPHLAKAVGTTVAVILGLIGTVIALAAIGGILQLTIAGLVGLQLAWTGATTAWLAIGKIGPAVLMGWNKALALTRAAVLAFNLALWANPILWVVMAVVALVAGLVLLVRHWDTVKAAALGFIDGFVQRWASLRQAIEGNPVLHFLLAPLLAGIDLVGFLISNLDKIPQWFGAFTGYLASLDIFGAPGRALDWLMEKWGQLRTAIADNAFLRVLFAPLTAGMAIVEALVQHLDKIPTWFKAFKAWLDKLNIFTALGSAADWLLDKLRLIPGLGKFLPDSKQPNVPGIDAAEKVGTAPIEQQVQAQRGGDRLAGLPATQSSAVPTGGISQQINNNQRGGMHIEKVEVHNPTSGKTFVDDLEMAAG